MVSRKHKRQTQTAQASLLVGVLALVVASLALGLVLTNSKTFHYANNAELSACLNDLMDGEKCVVETTVGTGGVVESVEIVRMAE